MQNQIIWRIYQLESCIAHESVPQVDTFFVFSMERDIPHRDTPGIFLFIHVNSKYFNFLPNNAISFQISNFYSKKYFVVHVLSRFFQMIISRFVVIKTTNCFVFDMLFVVCLFFSYVFLNMFHDICLIIICLFVFVCF